ncbi:MAG: methyltransferase domain-containing protein [Actinomycetota bacterium]
MAAYRLAASMVEGTALDAGCGEGYGTAILARRASRVIGLDLDEPTMTHARRNYAGQLFARGDLDRVPLAEGSLDAVVALQVIEHLSNPGEFLDGCVRALRPGGTLILSTPNRATFPAGLNPFHTREYDSDELRDLVESRFPDARLLGLAHGPRLRWIDGMLGEPIQDRLVRVDYSELPPMIRALLRTIRPRGFRTIPDPAAGLDLIAVCRSIEP